MPSGGGDESEVLTVPVDWANWALTPRGLYYATAHRPVRRQEFNIQYLDFSSGRVTPLYRTASAGSHGSLAVSPDEKWILFGEAPVDQSELMLMENFR